MLPKYPTNIANKGLRILPVGLLFVVFYLSINSCQSITPPDATTKRPLSELMTLELAVQRNDKQSIASIVNLLIKQPLSSATFAHLQRLLKSDRYGTLQHKVITAWLLQYPDEPLARQASVFSKVCHEPKTVVEPLMTLLDDNNALSLEYFLSCLEEEQVNLLTQKLFEERPDDERIQYYHINNLVQNNSAEVVLAAINNIPQDQRSLDVMKIQAKLLHESKKIAAALATYQYLYAQLTNDREVNFGLAEIYYDQNQHADALEHLQRILTLDRSDRQAQYLTAASHYALGNWSESEFWFMKLLTVSAYRNRAFYYLGEIALQGNDIDSAIEYFSKVKQSDYYLSAQLQLWRIIAKEQPELATMGLEQLAKEFPQDRLVIHLAEIELLAETGEELRALQKLVNLADDHPNNLRLQLLRLRWLVEQDHLSNITHNVLASLSGIMEIDSQFQLLESAVFYLISQDVAKPAVQILESQKYIPRDTGRYIFLEGIANAISGNYKTAIKGLEQLVALSPDNPAYQNALGYTLTLAGERLSEAESLIIKALELDPNNPAYLDSLAWLNYKRGNANEALELLREALRIEQSPSIYSHMIEILIEQGESELAIEALKKASGLFPRNRVISMLQKQLN